jgi:hypothetical protein
MLILYSGLDLADQDLVPLTALLNYNTHLQVLSLQDNVFTHEGCVTLFSALHTNTTLRLLSWITCSVELLSVNKMVHTLELDEHVLDSDADPRCVYFLVPRRERWGWFVYHTKSQKYMRGFKVTPSLDIVKPPKKAPNWLNKLGPPPEEDLPLRSRR